MYSDLISVIIPAYNAENTIERCVKSIIEQSYYNLDIIIINDGSKDNTLQILNNILDNRIRVISIKNQGVSFARNLGIKYALGKYLAFVDSDDYLEKNMFEELLKHYKNDSLVICNYKVKKKNKIINRIYKNEIKKDNVNELFFYMLEKNVMNAPWGKLYETNVIKKYKIEFENNLNLGEDYIFNLRYLKFINNIIFIDQGLYLYSLENENSLGKKYRENMIYIQEQIKNELIEFSLHRKMNNDDMKKIYMNGLRYLMIAVTNEFHSRSLFKYLNAKKVLNSKIIKDYLIFLKQNSYIKKELYFILNNNFIFLYLLFKRKYKFL